MIEEEKARMDLFTLSLRSIQACATMDSIHFEELCFKFGIKRARGWKWRKEQLPLKVKLHLNKISKMKAEQAAHTAAVTDEDWADQLRNRSESIMEGTNKKC